MGKRRILGDFEHTDRLWVVRPFWDEGDDYDPAEGTASVVAAATASDAEQTMRDHADEYGHPHWYRVHLLANDPDIPPASPEGENDE